MGIDMFVSAIRAPTRLSGRLAWPASNRAARVLHRRVEALPDWLARTCRLSESMQMDPSGEDYDNLTAPADGRERLHDFVEQHLVQGNGVIHVRRDHDWLLGGGFDTSEQGVVADHLRELGLSGITEAPIDAPQDLETASVAWARRNLRHALPVIARAASELADDPDRTRVRRRVRALLADREDETIARLAAFYRSRWTAA